MILKKNTLRLATVFLVAFVFLLSISAYKLPAFAVESPTPSATTSSTSSSTVQEDSRKTESAVKPTVESTSKKSNFKIAASPTVVNPVEKTDKTKDNLVKTPLSTDRGISAASSTATSSPIVESTPSSIDTPVVSSSVPTPTSSSTTAIAGLKAEDINPGTLSSLEVSASCSEGSYTVGTVTGASTDVNWNYWVEYVYGLGGSSSTFDPSTGTSKTFPIGSAKNGVVTVNVTASARDKDSNETIKTFTLGSKTAVQPADCSSPQGTVYFKVDPSNCKNLSIVAEGLTTFPTYWRVNASNNDSVLPNTGSFNSANETVSLSNVKLNRTYNLYAWTDDGISSTIASQTITLDSTSCATKTITIPEDYVSQAEVFGDRNDSYNTPNTIEGVTFSIGEYKDNGDGTFTYTVTAIPEDGYSIEGQTVWTFVDKGAVSGVAAPVIETYCGASGTISNIYVEGYKVYVDGEDIWLPKQLYKDGSGIVEVRDDSGKTVWSKPYDFTKNTCVQRVKTVCENNTPTGVVVDYSQFSKNDESYMYYSDGSTLSEWAYYEGLGFLEAGDYTPILDENGNVKSVTNTGETVPVGTKIVFGSRHYNASFAKVAEPVISVSQLYTVEAGECAVAPEPTATPTPEPTSTTAPEPTVTTSPITPVPTVTTSTITPTPTSSSTPTVTSSSTPTPTVSNSPTSTVSSSSTALPTPTVSVSTKPVEEPTPSSTVTSSTPVVEESNTASKIENPDSTVPKVEETDSSIVEDSNSSTPITSSDPLLEDDNSSVDYSEDSPPIIDSGDAVANKNGLIIAGGLILSILAIIILLLVVKPKKKD